VVAERYSREIAKRNPAHINAYYPGYLFCQDTVPLKDWGESESRPAWIAYSSFGFVKVYRGKTVISALISWKQEYYPYTNNSIYP